MSTLSKTKPAATKSLLQKGILGNAIFSGVSAIIMLVFANPISNFLGLSSAFPVTLVGIVLLVYAPLLFLTSRKNPVIKSLAASIVVLDILWILGSLILIFSNLAALSTGGKWVIAIVADIVAIFAVIQYIGIRKQST